MKCRTGCQGHQNSSWTVISQNVSCLAAADFQRWKMSSEWRAWHALAVGYSHQKAITLTQTEFTCSCCSSYGPASTLVARDGGTVSKVCKVTLTIAVLQRVLHSLNESCMILHIVNQQLYCHVGAEHFVKNVILAFLNLTVQPYLTKAQRRLQNLSGQVARQVFTTSKYNHLHHALSKSSVI